ncbi:unnamed protein product [Rhizoctonia solani]|uniref:Uncharacterized protein n=1 Tax=Rhizoctonia solani TaxID=456999 RepID=A0A8H3HFY3_9AGAM|nr:unnamed protein product [Rhizoctonia solani]
MASANIFTRIYTPSSGSLFRDQLNIWCDRVHIGHIRFSTNKSSYRDSHGHQLYEAIPIFPGIIDLRSIGRVGVQYDEKVVLNLAGSDVVGWGTSTRKAEEDAAQRLLSSGYYCFY